VEVGDRRVCDTKIYREICKNKISRSLVEGSAFSTNKYVCLLN